MVNNIPINNIIHTNNTNLLIITNKHTRVNIKYNILINIIIIFIENNYYP